MDPQELDARVPRMLQSTNSSSPPSPGAAFVEIKGMEGWELCAIFLIFMGITVSWEGLVGLLTFLNNVLRGRKADWLHRVKEELLALGVVSLVLLFLEPSLQEICVPDDRFQQEPPESGLSPYIQQTYAIYYCPVGSRQVFSRKIIHGSHYLLFFLAIIHIIFSLITSVLTNASLARWSGFERDARKEANIPQLQDMRLRQAGEKLGQMYGRQTPKTIYHDITGRVDFNLYSVLRFMAEKRFAAHHVVLRNFNFLNMAEQCLEAEMNHVFSHAWIVIFMMALLLLYNTMVLQTIWFSSLCLLMTVFMSLNLRWVLKKTGREACSLYAEVDGIRRARMGLDAAEAEEVNGTQMSNAGDGTSQQETEMTQKQDMQGQWPGMQLGGKGPGPLGEGMEQYGMRYQAAGQYQHQYGNTLQAQSSMQQPSGMSNAGLGYQGYNAHGYISQAGLGSGGPGSDGAGGGGPRQQPWLGVPLAASPGQAEMVPVGPVAESMLADLNRASMPVSMPSTPMYSKYSSLDMGMQPQDNPLFQEQQGGAMGMRAHHISSGAGGSVSGSGMQQGLMWASQSAVGMAPAGAAASNAAMASAQQQLAHLQAALRTRGSMHSAAGAGSGSGEVGMPGFSQRIAGGFSNDGVRSSSIMGNGGPLSSVGGAHSHQLVRLSKNGHVAASRQGTNLSGSTALGHDGATGELPSGDVDGDSGCSGSGCGGSHSGDDDASSRSNHSEGSIAEQALAEGIEEKIIKLFFFGKPWILLWVYDIIFAQASLTLTTSMAFIIPYDKFKALREASNPLEIWLPMVLLNLFMVLYLTWVFLPQYALLATCGVFEPHEVMHEIRKSKTQDDDEHGLAAVVLDKLTEHFVGKHDGEVTLSTAFIVTLANQAGIILGQKYDTVKEINRRLLKPVYREFVQIWHDIVWYGELKGTYIIRADTQAFRGGFEELDDDGSGELSFMELANMIRSMGTYATSGDVEAMLWEIDIDNSHSIGFDEFVKFCTFAFFDPENLGYIDQEALLDGMERLGMPLNELQVQLLLSISVCEEGEQKKVTMRQFFEMFMRVCVEPPDEDGSDSSGDGSGMLNKLAHAFKDTMHHMRPSAAGTPPAPVPQVYNSKPKGEPAMALPPDARLVGPGKTQVVMRPSGAGKGTQLAKLSRQTSHESSRSGSGSRSGNGSGSGAGSGGSGGQTRQVATREAPGFTNRGSMPRSRLGAGPAQ